VLIEEVEATGPAARAGLRRGDIVTTIAGREVNDPESLRYRIATLPIGETAQLGVLRQGRPSTLSVALVPPPETPPRELTRVQGPLPLAGATVANLSPALADELGFQGPSRGVVVVEVERGSNAARVGFRPGDVLLRVNGEAFTAARSVASQLSGPRAWRIELRRGTQTLTLQVQA
jgi:S1-C subfamily serine protease